MLSPPETAVPSTSNSPLTCIERTSPSFSISSGPSSPALSNAADIQKRRSRSTSLEPQDAKRMREDDKFGDMLSKFINQPRSEVQTFCSFLQSRLEKLEKKNYMRVTHIIMQEVMKIELEQGSAYE